MPSDKPDPKDILDAIENILEERKTKGDRRKQSKPVKPDRRSINNRRDVSDDVSDDIGDDYDSEDAP